MSLSKIQTTTNTGTAQYFQAADKVVILGNHGVQEQGLWQDIKFKTGSTIKFESNMQEQKLSATYDKLGAQLRASEEAEIDLSRETGDTALYGM
jgi:ATP-binding cassette subfamily C (CFTR/MRP) protein 1